MKTIPSRLLSSRRPAALILAALCATAPFSLSAQTMGGDASMSEPLPPTATAPTAPAPAPAELPPMTAEPVDLNHPEAVKLMLSARIVTDTVDNADFAIRESAVALARRGAEEGEAITSSLKAGAQALAERDRKAVDKAVAKAEAERDALAQALAKAADATEDDWAKVRGEIAKRYEKYAGVLESARETAVKRGVRFSPELSGATPDSVRG